MKNSKYNQIVTYVKQIKLSSVKSKSNTKFLSHIFSINYNFENFK